MTVCYKIQVKSVLPKSKSKREKKYIHEKSGALQGVHASSKSSMEYNLLHVWFYVEQNTGQQVNSKTG